MKIVNKSLRKKDAMQLVTGQPVYTEDLIPNDCLIVKVHNAEALCFLIAYIDNRNCRVGAAFFMVFKHF